MKEGFAKKRELSLENVQRDVMSGWLGSRATDHSINEVAVDVVVETKLVTVNGEHPSRALDDK